jgi:hypothetical protein
VAPAYCPVALTSCGHRGGGGCHGGTQKPGEIGWSENRNSGANSSMQGKTPANGAWSCSPM